MRTLLLSILIAIAPLCSFSQLINNYDTCRTQTFYQYIGSATKETHLVKARTVQDNGIVNAGYTRVSTSQDAIVIKQNGKGEVLWQKEYGNTAYDEQFTDWRELPNRQLLLGGTTRNRATNQSVFFMMLLSADGNIIWQRSYASLAPASNINNAKIYQNFWGEYFFAVETNSSIIYGMVNSAGVIWQRSLNASAGTKLVAAVSYYSNLLIATNSLDSGHRVANFFYVNYYTTGNPKLIKHTIKLGGVGQNSHYILHDYEHTSQYTYFTGIRSVNNGAYELLRININQGYLRQALETIVTPGIVIDSSSRSAINTYGDVVSFTSGRKNNRFHATKLTGSENIPTRVIWSTSYQIPDRLVLRGSIKTWDRGFVFFGNKELPGGFQKIIQIKTDSASITSSCINRQSQNFSIVRNTFPGDSVKYTYNSDGLVDFNYSGAETSGIVDTLSVCKEIKCPSLPSSDSCLDSYQKLYKAYDDSYVNSMQIVNGRTFVSGIVTPMDHIPEYGTSFIAEMNSNGQVINQKKYVIGIGAYTHLSKAADNNLLLYGFTWDSAYYPAIMLAKIDTDLNVTWIRSLRLSTTQQFAHNQSTSEVKQSSDGGYFIQYSDGTTFGATTIYLTKLDANGNHLWSKVYRPSYPGVANVIKGRRMVISGGNVYIMCSNAYNAYAASILLKISESNGALQWCKKYSNGAENLNLEGLMHMQNNELIVGGTMKLNSNGESRNILAKIGVDGPISNAVTLNHQATNTAPAMLFLHDGVGKVYMTSRYYNTLPFSNSHQINVTVNSNFDIVTSKKRPSMAYNTAFTMAVGPEGRVYESGTYQTSFFSEGLTYVAKFSTDGRLGTCPSDSMLLQKEAAPSISVSDITCLQADIAFTIRTPVFRTSQSFLGTSKLLCVSVPGCNSIDVTGSALICNKTLSYSFRAVRNTGCEAPIQWVYSNSNVQVISELDSVLTLRFLASGTYKLKARFTSNCVEYIDSLTVTVIGNAPILNLGADTSICQGATLLLNARKGFRSYAWQNGSTDSTFLVTTGGVYHITTIDSCNNIVRDTIVVQMSGNGPVLNLGPDRNYCTSSMIVLNAQAGFLSYLWQNGTTDSILTATQPGLYHVTVTDACSNTFRDTVKISSYRKASSLNLGADTTFCSAASLPIRAGAGFASYVWQDGSVDSMFLAQSTGLYFLTVIDSCGNTFRDSIRISPDTNTPFDIGPNKSVCKGDSILVQVTAGLANYVWWPQVNVIPQSATAITVFPSSNTWYYVSAIKPNGCRVTDSIKIDVYISQIINLGPDISICAGDTITLNAGSGFNNYSWSTGAQSVAIGVYQPGQYYVSATDINNCKSRDTMNVLQTIPLPDIQLANESAICQGQPLVLKAGSGFTRYLWNTGAVTENITISSLGVYSVTVTNASGCRQSDSIHVNRVLPSPANFIKYKDSTICNFETFTLTTNQNFPSYIWSNGSTLSSITVSNAGEYTLGVTDINGCSGIDTFTLATKECNLGVFFPNSFTPNNDGLNDTYKAKAFGVLNDYHMIIYNRYGEKVFDTRNIATGWNGVFKGIQQETGAFVWQCWYQLGGSIVQRRSGSLLLIR